MEKKFIYDEGTAVVDTDKGKVRGYFYDDMYIFKGMIKIFIQIILKFYIIHFGGFYGHIILPFDNDIYSCMCIIINNSKREK